MSHLSGPEGTAGPEVTKPVRRVGFGDHESWADLIRPHLKPRYVPSFVDLSQIRLEDFDAIIPVQIRHYEPLFRRPELRRKKFFHPSAEVIAVCDDKLRLAEFLIAQGFGNFIAPPRASGPPYPYVRKRRQGWWGLHCHIVKSVEDERNLDLADNAWFSQAFVPGEIEFSTHILRVGGQICYASTFAHKMASAALVNGAHDKPIETQFTSGCKYLDLFSKILARLEYEGTSCFDYKVLSGQPVLLEINPRFGGSLCRDITAYVDAYLGSLEH